jgi:hypothetical protein
VLFQTMTFGYHKSRKVWFNIVSQHFTVQFIRLSPSRIK